MTSHISLAATLATDDSDVGKAGPVGLFLIVSLLIAVFLLGRSMRTHLRRVPPEFPDLARPGPDRADSGGEVLEGEVLDGNGPERPDTSSPGRP